MRPMLSEEEIREILRELDFKRTYPELIVRLINEAGKRSKDIFFQFRELVTYVEREIDTLSNLIVRADISQETVDKPVVGLDGSFVLIKGIGRRFFLIYSVSVVSFERGVLSIENPEISIDMHVKELLEKDDESLSKRATIVMMMAETKGLIQGLKKAKGGFIFIDGPIIDPPNETSEEYVSLRVENIYRIYKSKTNLIGFIKRFKSRIFSRVIGIKEATDREIIPLLFSIYRSTNDYEGAIYTKPISLAEDDIIRREVYSLYASLLREFDVDIDIFASYVQTSKNTRPAKIEVIARDQKGAEKIVENVVSVLSQFTYPGSYIPLPVALAHQTCTIRKNVAYTIIREILTRTAYLSTFDPNLSKVFLDLYMEEVEA